MGRFRDEASCACFAGRAIEYDKLKKSTDVDALLTKVKASALYKELYDRPDFYSETAKIEAPLYIYTGELDLITASLRRGI